MDRINAGEMPPKKAAPPEARRICPRVAIGSRRNWPTPSPPGRPPIGEKVSFRRLSREEYRNTIRDLLGVTYDATDPSGLPEDPDWQGFERIGTVLTLSAAHVEKYLAAAETILNEALALGPQPKVETTRLVRDDMRTRGDVAQRLTTRGLLDKVRIDIVPNNGALDAHDLNVETAGEYRRARQAERPAARRGTRSAPADLCN